MTIPAKPPRRVVVLAYDGLELLDLTGPVNVLSAATRLVPAHRGYAIEIVAPRKGLVRTESGVCLDAPRACASVRGPIDTLIVPGATRALPNGLVILPAVRRLAPLARRVVAVCSGAFLLAECGLLDGRSAVTHWAGCEALRKRHPRVRVEEDAIYVRDGKVWTSAGVTSGMDLALALVEQDLGAKVALDVARWLVMYLRRPGGQSQFSAPLAAQSAQRAPIQAVLEWAREHLSADLGVGALARRASMSERNFARVFADETGVTPAAWVSRTRLEAARAALELTDDTVKTIASVCGFGSPESLHRAFQRALHTTPLAYRARFRTSLG